MAVKAVSVAQTFEHVLDSDPDKKKTKVFIDADDPAKGFKEEVQIGENATIFGLKTLDVFLLAYIYDNSSSLLGRAGSQEVGIKTLVNQTNIEAVRFGLSYFKNFRLEEGGAECQVEFQDHIINGRTYKVATDNTLRLIGLDGVQELAQQIKEHSEVQADQEKKSGK